ncbi:MAG: hypothetical protein NZ954_03960 [Thermofilaceae archaeon]|nr:hypothetical protein [Thermofilaceae archaeon]MCX8180830.1 hypothetical protein [Thermofilaceae archaeon]MDW8004616.1 hypothetical protein [Thermofilaceae archaeon]
MVFKRKKALSEFIVAVAITATIAVLSFFSRIENFLSMYYFQTVYPWYPHWRIAVAMFLLWIIASTFASRERKLFVWLMVTSALTLALAHYSMLLAETSRGVEVKLLPLLNLVEVNRAEIYRVDIAQVVLTLTAVECYFISRKPPRTALSGQQTPSR